MREENVHVNERCRRKEEASKAGHIYKQQSKATQFTHQGSLFSKEKLAAMVAQVAGPIFMHNLTFWLTYIIPGAYEQGASNYAL